MKTKHLFLITFLVLSWTFSSCTKEKIEPGELVPKTVDEDPTLPFIEVNDTKLHAETFGNPDDPIIIMLHGGPGGDYRYMRDWKAFAEDSFFVVFFDQRGSGLSRRHGEDVYKGNTFLDDLKAIIQHYRKTSEQKVFLMGHSWGAMYATWFVDNYPNEVDGLILTEPGGFTQSQTQEYTKKAFKADIFAEWLNDVTWRDQLVSGKSHEALDYNWMLLLVGNVGTGDDGITEFWRVGNVCHNAIQKHHQDYNWTNNLHRFTSEVLFFYTQNPAYGRAHAESVSGAYPNVNLHELQNTGHEISNEAFSDYHTTALNYMKKIINQ